MAIATIILKTGERVSLDVWQGLYDLPVKTNKIGKYFTIGEPYFFNGMEISSLLIQLSDQVRINLGKPLVASSSSRTEKRQQELLDEGVRAATVSPHTRGMAIDYDVNTKKEALELANAFLEAAKQLGIKIRIGVYKYLEEGKTFVHLDVCPEYYAKGKPYHSTKHPEPWEREMVW